MDEMVNSVYGLQMNLLNILQKMIQRETINNRIERNQQEKRCGRKYIETLKKKTWKHNKHNLEEPVKVIYSYIQFA
jgi:hypothetical protein